LSNLTQSVLTTTPSQVIIEGFAKTYIKYWPNEVKDDVYNLLQQTDKDLLFKDITDAINFANGLNLGS